jgi:uncharacterized Zn finger protein (UPF0148 family)
VKKLLMVSCPACEQRKEEEEEEKEEEEDEDLCVKTSER